MAVELVATFQCDCCGRIAERDIPREPGGRIDEDKLAPDTWYGLFARVAVPGRRTLCTLPSSEAPDPLSYVCSIECAAKAFEKFAQELRVKTRATASTE